MRVSLVLHCPCACTGLFNALTLVCCTKQILIADNSEFGVYIPDLIRNNRQFTSRQIRDAVDDLASEGVIYSTITEDYFKAAM